MKTIQLRAYLMFLMFLILSYAVKSQKVTIGGLKHPINTFGRVDLSPSGNLVAATVANSGNISVFETFSGKEVQRLNTSNPLRGAYFLNDSIIVCIGQRGIELKKIQNDSMIVKMEMRSLIFDHSYSAESQKFVIHTLDSIYYLSCSSGKIKNLQAIPASNVSNLSISPDGTKISFRKDDNILLWDTKLKTALASIPGENIISVGAGNEFLFVVVKNPFSFRYYNYNGTPKEMNRTMPLISAPYSTEVHAFDRGFVFSTYNKTVVTYFSGFQEVIKTGLDFHKAKADMPGQRIISWSRLGIEITDMEGALFTRIIPQQLNSIHLLADSEREIVHVVAETEISIIEDEKNKKLLSLESKSIAVPEQVGDWQLIPLENRSVKIFDLKNDKVIASFAHPSIPVHYAKSPDSKILWFTDYTDNSVYSYKIESGEKIKIYTQEKIITSVAASSFSNRLFIGDESGTLKEISISQQGIGIVNREIFILSGHISYIKPLKDGLLAASYGRFLFVPANFSDTLNQRLFIGHNAFISSLETNSTEEFIYSTADDGHVKIWDRANVRMISDYKLDSGIAKRVINPEGGNFYITGNDFIIGGIEDNEVIEKYKTVLQKIVIQSPNNNSPLKLAFNNEGNLLAAVDKNTVKVRDMKSGFLVSEFSTENKIVNGITFSPIGNMLAVAAGEYIYCYEPYTGKLIRKIDLSMTRRAGSYGNGSPALFSRSLHDVEAFNNAFIGFNIHGWHDPIVVHKNSGLKLFELFINTGKEFDNSIYDLNCRKDGSWIATFGSSFVKLFSNKNSGLKLEFIYPRLSPDKIIRGYNDYMSFSPDGNYFLWTDISVGKRIRIIELSTGKVIRDHEGGLGALGKDGHYMYLDNDDMLIKANLVTGEEETLNFKWDGQVNNLVYNETSNIYALSDNWGNIKVIDGRSGKSINELNRWDQYTYTTLLSPDKQHLLFNNRWGQYLLNINTLKREPLPGNNYPFSGVFDPEGKTIYFRNNNTILSRTVNVNETETIFTDEDLQKNFGSMSVSSDGQHLILKYLNNKVVLVNIKEKKNLFSFDRFSFKEGSGLIVKDVLMRNGLPSMKAAYINTYDKNSGVSYAYVSTDQKFSKESITPEMKFEREGESGFTTEIFKRDLKVFELSPSGKYLAFMQGLELFIVDPQTKDTLFSRDNPIAGEIIKGNFDEKEKYFVLATEDGYIEVYDLETRTIRKRKSETQTGLKLISRFKANEMGINDIHLVGDRLLVNGSNSFITLFKVGQENKKLIDMVFIRDDDQLFIDEKGYYYASKNALPFVAYKQDSTIFTLDLMDLKYNRPDRVLQSAQSKDNILITAYQNAYLKRIKRQQFDTTWQPKPGGIPDCKLINAADIPYDLGDKKIKLHLKMLASQGNLVSMNIWINNTPLFGKNGTSFKGVKKNSKDTIVTIILSEGVNKIEYAVRNSEGMESSRVPIYVRHTPKIKSSEKVHFVGIGIDQFADSKFNLQYSAKDIRDLSAKLKEKFGDNITIDTLFNENVTISNIKALKQKLLQTSVNDKVIISYSGHGLLNKEYDYYLSTYSVNFNKPEEKGLPYEELENLLDSIPARKKLMMIDACHSGEVDKDEVFAMNKNADSLGLAKGVLPEGTQTQHLGLKNSFELMQSLFINVGKSTGATIISAAAGNQFALEMGGLKNGVFTYSILEAMKNHPTMKISELKKIVGDRVEQLTNGMQKPTSRNETIAVDWSLW